MQTLTNGFKICKSYNNLITVCACVNFGAKSKLTLNLVFFFGGGGGGGPLALPYYECYGCIDALCFAF